MVWFWLSVTGDSKIKTKVEKDFVNTYKILSEILRNGWRDLREKGVLYR